MEQHRLEPFDLSRALAGEPVVSCSGVDISEIKHFAGIPTNRVCIAAVLGVGEDARLRVYSLDLARESLRIKTPIDPHSFDPCKLAEGWIVRTCDGQEVKQATVFKSDGPYTVYGVVNGRVERWTPDGCYCIGHQTMVSPLDLVMYPPE